VYYVSTRCASAIGISDPSHCRERVSFQKLLRKNDTLRYVDHITTEGLAMFAGAPAVGLEGIVAKDPKSPYVEGPTETWHWQKIKNKDYKRQDKVDSGKNERERLGPVQST
jgi:ATP-dependent DNA ligase